MREQVGNLTRPLRRQAGENVFQIGIWIMAVEPCRLDQTHDRRRTLAAAQRACKQPVRAPQSPRPYLVVG